MKKILITGAFGFFGQHLVFYYKSKGFYVHAIGFSRNKNHMITKIADNYLIGDITVDNLKSIDIDFDAIVHCAGGSSVGKSMENPIQDLQKSTVGSEHILEYIRLHSPHTRMVYISSAAVYGDKYFIPISESKQEIPMSFYGIHKYLSEELCRFYVNRFDLNISVIRFFSIYGPELKKQLLWDACNKINTDASELTFFGTGDEIRDWIEISDAIDIVNIMVESKERFSIVNAGTGTGVNVRTVLEKLVGLFGTGQKISFNGETKVGDPEYLCADMTKMFSKNWKPKVTLDDGLKKYVDWYKRNINAN